MTLAACTVGAPSLGLVSPRGGSTVSAYGDTPSEVCGQLAALANLDLLEVTAHSCKLDTVPGVYPVVAICEKLSSSPFVMSVEDGVFLASAIGTVWVSAAVWRWLTRSLGNRGESD